MLTWYESMPQDVWNQWLAYDNVEHVGCEWERHASMMAMLEAVYAATLNPHLEKKDRIKPRQAEEFLPRGFAAHKKRKVPLIEQLKLAAKVFAR